MFLSSFHMQFYLFFNEVLLTKMRILKLGVKVDLVIVVARIQYLTHCMTEVFL